ncbi:LysR substrate-binding domain-containing protein [Chachezhania antarctica]|uniref:LysR substrate-binding domain-containing protein n=1 Tax=Chachezhania antarctica TaxID=2340860 RepID=UPI000EAC63E5|nr:LysR substrate-binding domain-containing protein [Chachezhania antarctica]
MAYARKLLPSMSALRILEAMDRLGSVSSAAEDLALTQGAVSRQLQALEAQLGMRLARRDGRRLVLTPEAHVYAAEIRSVLARVAEATMRLQTAPVGGTLSLAILPAFGMRWLVPRLPDFARRHPEITINMTTRLEAFAFAQEPFDAAIRYGTGHWPGCDSLLLKHEALIPVAAPSLMPNGRPAPEDLARLPLLHIRTRPDIWADWFHAKGVTQAHPLTGTMHDQFSTITQAACHGLGAALMPDYLVDRELATGQLVALDAAPTEAAGAYYLVWPQAGADAKLMQFRDWLAGQTEAEDTLPR